MIVSGGRKWMHRKVGEFCNSGDILSLYSNSSFNNLLSGVSKRWAK